MYLDVVVNHTADVVQLQGNAGFLDPGQAPYRDCHGKVFAPARYVRAKTFPCLSVANMPYRPFFAVPSDAKAKNPAWLNDPTNYHDRGDIDFSSGNQASFEQGDFFGLDDLFTEQPAVMSGLAQIYGNWVTKYHVDGFRVDTARHVNSAFFGLWVPRILAAARSVGIRDFPIFGEVTLTDDIELSAFVRDRGLPSVLDFPFQDAATGFAAGTTGAKALASRFADDDYYRDPSARRRRRRRSSATTTWAGRRSRSSSTAPRRTRSCSPASNSATTSSTCSAAPRSSTTATRWG